MTLLSLFDNQYGITEDGKMWSCRRNKFLKPGKDKDGYLYYVISIKGVRKTIKAHRLVAETYIPNPENKPTVNHINGIRDDNRVENLEWATYREQQLSPVTKEKQDVIHANTDYKAMGEKRNFGRRSVRAYKDGVLVGEYSSLKIASANLGISASKISMVINGHRKKAGGMSFETT